MISEIRYVVRSLLRRKGFALVTVLTLALGIGSATAIYAVVDWVLFKAPASPKDLYNIGSSTGDGQFMPITWQAQYEAYSTRKDIFSELGAAAYQTGNVVVDHVPVGTGTLAISINLLKMLNVAPAVGRGFSHADEVQGRDTVAIVDDGFARKYLGGPGAALGRKVIINEQECVVVGVLAKGKRMPPYLESDVMRPLILRPNAASPWDPALITFGRARPGASRMQIEEALAKTKVDVPAVMSGFIASIKPAVSTIGEMEKIYRPELYWMLLGAVGFLFSIACLNATNLLLVHMAGRQLETSIRLALGGSRWRIVRLLLMETIGLCVCGSAIGALLANWLVPIFNMVANAEDGVPVWTSWHLGARTYLVLGCTTILTGFAIAIFPALHVLRSNIQNGLRNGGGSIGESPSLARVRGLFVVLQATFAVILLVGAGLMIRTFQKLENVKLGFDPSHRIKMQINFPSTYPTEAKERFAVLNRLHDALERVPGVSGVAFGSNSLLAGYEGITLEVEASDGAKVTVNAAYVSPDYQKAGGMVLKAGRWLAPEDKVSIMVNESMARQRFGTENPVGQYLKPFGATGADKGWLVVGLVGDVRENLRNAPGKKIYMPAEWSPATITSFVIDMQSVPDGESATKLREAIYQFDPRIVTFSSGPIMDQLKEQLRHERLALSVLKVLAAIAILLTIVGLFSVLAYTVDRRMPEFGIRMALGATPANLVRLVISRGMALTAIGVAAGIAAAMAMTRFLQSLLFETAPFDPPVIVGVAGLLLLSALAACALPALRASRPDVATLLKGE